MEKKRIVILGAGFGGIAAARTLGKELQADKTLAQRVSVLVVDQNDEHTYTPGLYETATTLRRDAEPLELKRASTMRVSDLLERLPVSFLQDRVERISVTDRHLMLRDSGEISFNKLIVAAGSRATDFGIPGVREHADFLKTFNDALHIRRVLTEKLVDENDPNILIVGGGASGVEVAGEIIGFAKQLCSRDGRLCSPAVSILEGGDTLVRGLSEKVSRAAKKRLDALGVSVVFGARVTAVHENRVDVVFRDGETATLPHRMLIWTAGIEPQQVCSCPEIETDERGRWVVDAHLRTPGHEGVYAVGDITTFKPAATTPDVPATAYVAIRQGSTAAKNVLAELKEESLTLFTPNARAPMVIPIGGKWAIAHFAPFAFTGFIAFVVRLLIDLHYFLSVLPPKKAWRFFRTSVRMYFSND